MRQHQLLKDLKVVITYLRQVLILLKRLFVCFVAYLICRILFFGANKSYFPNTGTTDLLKDCFFGLRFDSFSIVLSNSLFILLSLLPLNAFRSASYQKFLFWLFIISNAVFVSANFIDVGYFPFIKKRASAEIFDQLGGQSDMGKLIPVFLLDFWWIVLLFALSMYLMVVLYKRVGQNVAGVYTRSAPKHWLIIT